MISILTILPITNNPMTNMTVPDHSRAVFLSPKGASTMYKRIKISFINTNSVTIDEGDWDDYDLCDGFIVIKKGEAWVAMYNAKEIFSVVLEK